jgi:AcrR family transcriptional regulator
MVPEMGSTGLSEAWPDRAKGQLMLTMAAVSSERGYAATRVSDVLDRAGISRRTFYAYFESRQDCFFATHSAIVADIAALLATADGDLRGLLVGLLEYCATWPAHAHVVLIEILAAGPPGVRRHEQTMSMLADRLARCPPWQPGSCRGLKRPDAAQAALGAMVRVLQRKLVTDGPETIPGLLPALLTLATKVRLDP